MARLQCPRCGTVIEETAGMAPVCPGCGFQGEPPAPESPTGAPSAAPHPTSSPPSAPAPSATPYGAAPGAGGYGGGYGGGQPYSTPQPLGPPGQPAPGYDNRPTNGMAVASLVLSLVGLCVGITAILGVIFGIIGRNQCREKNEKGEGMALAGIIVGAVIIGLWLLYFFFLIMMIGMEF